jgi:hypothetical protein
MPKAKRVLSTSRLTAPIITRRPNPPARPLVDLDGFPDVYSLCLEGECLEPLVPDGASVVLQKSAAYTVDDIVCIWWRPEFVTPGRYQGWLKRVRMAAPPWVKKYPYNDHPESDVGAVIVMEQLNPSQCYAVPCNRIHAIHKAVAYGPAATVGGSIRSDQLMPIGAGIVPQLGRR